MSIIQAPESAAVTELDSEQLARFEKALRIFADCNFPPERAARQLLAHGYPVSLVRAHFPDLPDSAFVAPSVAVRGRRVARDVQQGEGASAPTPPGTAQLTRDLLQDLRTRSIRTAAVRAVPVAAIEPTCKPVAATPTQSVMAPASCALEEGISFQYVPLIQCSFPHADPGSLTSFTRRNGWLELTLATARADTGLPYGVPARLLTIYCASEAVRTRSSEIFLGASVHEFLRRLDVPVTRGERGSLRVYANQLLRLVHCAVSVDENIRDTAGRVGLHIRQAMFVEEARLWWDERQGVGEGSSLMLSSVLYDSILERSAPLSTSAIKQLRKSPMDLDVYAWLVHRLFHLQRPSTVTWLQLSGQFGHGYAELRKFRRFFADSVKRVLEVYPAAKLKLADVGVILMPSAPHIPRDALTGSTR